MKVSGRRRGKMTSREEQYERPFSTCNGKGEDRGEHEEETSTEREVGNLLECVGSRGKTSRDTKRETC